MTQATLPEDFAPGDRDVVIGKGKKFYFHAGNQWLRQVVGERTEEYSKATNKTGKSMILSSVVDYVRTNGRFVRLDNKGAWVVAEQLLCREKCSAVFREKLRVASNSNPSPSPNQNRARVDSSSDLIKRMVAANISSVTSKDNLRYAMSMSTGNLNLLKPSRSGQFAAAKKQRSFRGIKNATWGESKPNNTNSNAFHNLFPLNPTPLQVPSQMGSNALDANQMHHMTRASRLHPRANFQQAPASSLENQLIPTAPLGNQLVEDFRLKALKQMDAQLSDLVDARAQQISQGKVPATEKLDQGEDLEELLNMPIMDLNPDDVDQFGMDASNMSAFPDQQQPPSFAAV